MEIFWEQMWQDFIGEINNHRVLETFGSENMTAEEKCRKRTEKGNWEISHNEGQTFRDKKISKSILENTSNESNILSAENRKSSKDEIIQK